jgi:endonuclease YncB( thermonuclease family)
MMDLDSDSGSGGGGETQEYVYRLVDEGAERVVDGDTYWLRLDVGFRAWVLAHIRLEGVDTPEMHRGSEREREAAVVARQAAVDFLGLPGLGWRIWVQTRPDPGVYGRWQARVWAEGENGEKRVLAEELLGAGLATEWPTKWREVYDTDG